MPDVRNDARPGTAPSQAPEDAVQPFPDIADQARRHAQELVSANQVNFLAGFWSELSEEQGWATSQQEQENRSLAEQHR